MREFATKKEKNTKKQVLLLISLSYNLGLPKNKKHLAIFYEENLHTFVLKLSLGAFCFENSSFSLWLLYHFHIVFALASMSYGSVLLYRSKSRMFRIQEFQL